MVSLEAIEESFLTQVVRVRSEIRDKLLIAHTVLQDREAYFLAKLQELEDVFIGVITPQINQLTVSKMDLRNSEK